MKKIFAALTVAALLLPVAVDAQNQATAANSFVWDQPAPGAVDANNYTYSYYEGTVKTAFTGVSCTGTTSPFRCVVKIPAFSPGQHSITITATNVAGESAKSSPFVFNMVVTPATPVNIGIQ